MKKLMLIVNPTSGRQLLRSSLFDIIEALSLSGYEVTVFPTQRRGHATDLALASGAYDLLVCCGGDGTLNEVISGLMGLTHRPALGYIPAGTTNDLAVTLGLPRDPVLAVHAIVEGAPLLYDIGAFEERYFAYVAAFGAFTGVSYSTPQPLKNSFGHVAYILEGIRSLPEVRACRLRITHDGIICTSQYIFGAVTNSTSVAGLFRLREDAVHLSDGLFEVMLVKKPQNLAELNRIITGLYTQRYDAAYVSFFHTSALTVECLDGPMSWSLDGEDSEARHMVHIKNMRGAITFRTPSREMDVIGEM
ncbi:MAG: YegS/Rv2252/BmrU family lipid kinase [Oscillospiraceae bacterium]